MLSTDAPIPTTRWLASSGSWETEASLPHRLPCGVLSIQVTESQHGPLLVLDQIRCIKGINHEHLMRAVNEPIELTAIQTFRSTSSARGASRHGGVRTTVWIRNN